MMNQKQCKLCKSYAVDPIMLVCSHYLCYQCGLKIQIHDTTSLIQGKFRIQCPECSRQTYTYEIQNLLLDTQELNLITDSSELDKEQLHESQLSHNAIPQQDPIFQRRVSKIINRQEINFQVYNNDKNNYSFKDQSIKQAKQITMTPTNHTAQLIRRSSKPNPSSEKLSPPRSIAFHKQRKSSLAYQLDSSINIDERNLINLSQNQKTKTSYEPPKITLSALSTPSNAAYTIGFSAHHHTTSHLKQQNDLAGRAYNEILERASNITKEQQFFRPGIADQPASDAQRGENLFQIKSPQNAIFANNNNFIQHNNQQMEKENNQDSSFILHKKPSPSQPYNPNMKHKRSATGIIQIQQQAQDSDQMQVIHLYFQMLQKNLQKVEQDILLKIQKNKNIDANYLYNRLKRLSQKLQTKNEDDLIQQIRVIQELRIELCAPTHENIKNSPHYPMRKLL